MKTDTKISKRLAFWLRHQPEDAGLTLAAGGWTDVAAVLEAFRTRGLACDGIRLARVVAENDKKRFEFSEDGSRIRARQGHSVKVELGLAPLAPPEVLFHGTATRFLASILNDGLRPMARHHVHLSPDRSTSVAVGRRHGIPAVLEVAALAMASAGHLFYKTENGVWLTDCVPPEFLSIRN